MPLKRVFKYQFLVEVLTALLAGEVFDLDAVLDDFSWHISKTSPTNTMDTDLCLDRDRLELISSCPRLPSSCSAVAATKWICPLF